MTDALDPGTPAVRTPTAVDALAEEYLDAMAALDPITATFAGLVGPGDALTDYSPGAHQARASLARSTLARLDSLVARDGEDEITVASLSERLAHTLDLHDAGLDLADLNNIESPVQLIRTVFDVSPTATVQDWEAVASRLHAVPKALAGYREGLREAFARGWVAPRRQVRIAAGQATDFAAPDGFFARYAASAAPADDGRLPERLAERLQVGARAAASAYSELADWLTMTALPGARTDDAVGPDVYALAARGHLGTRIDLAETYAWGLEELAAIERRMAQVARVIAPDATGSDPLALVVQAVAVLDADPRRTVTGAEAFRDWMQELSDRAVDGLAGTHFDIAAPLRTLRCRIAPSTSGSIYYTGPSEDFSRPGQMWWAVPAGVSEFSTWRETSTVFHEGVPGHHLQIGQAVHRADRLNRWRRMGLWVSGHGEGWALYAERLMEQLGYLEDPGDLLGMLDAQALRACRVVVDIGVHLRLPAPDEVGGGTWDAEKAWAFLSRHTRVCEPTRRFELDRYLGWPGQAISYKVGERVWLGLRSAVQAREGAAFDLRTFHQRALDLGPVSLDVLTRALLPA